jgi:hypothetical protein
MKNLLYLLIIIAMILFGAYIDFFTTHPSP